MKNATHYAKRLKRLHTALKRDKTKPRLAFAEDPLEQLMRGILGRTASETRAAAAVNRLRDAVVDLNELRVTPVSELVEIIGAEYPEARSVADALARVLVAIFNRRHNLDLAFLTSGGRKNAESFLQGLDGIDPHATASVILGALGGHAIPVDDHMLAFLRRGDYVDRNAERGEVQGFLERQFKAKDGRSFYALLKRHSATHAPKPRRTAATTEPAVRKKDGRAAATSTKRGTARSAAARHRASSGSRPAGSRVPAAGGSRTRTKTGSRRAAAGRSSKTKARRKKT